MDPTSGATVVLLGENELTTRVLPIFVGPVEAQAIAIGLQQLVLPRPGTHDLIVEVLEQLGARVTMVVVTELKDGTFYAELEISDPAKTHRVSVRPSDGFALATRAGVPVQVDTAVFDAASVEVVRTPDEPFEQEEIESIVDQFRDFLAETDPEGFSDPDPPSPPS